MMGLYFLVLVAVGILRPIRNSLALDGLAEGDFYQVYLVSALVVLFAPAFNHLADRFRWRTLIPATAVFFAMNLVVFRALYREGSTSFGMVFYGWYDLFAAALVTQYFMAAQLFFNARDAKFAVPLVIAVGSLGVVFGSFITGFFAQVVGTPNLLLVAAGFVLIFAAAVSILWKGQAPVRPAGSRPDREGLSAAVRDVVEIFSHRHILLIARLVLVTVLVKQIVDFEFNEAVRVFLGNDRDSISSFQGYVIGVQNALPILVLIPLGPLLRRYGVGLAVLILPVAMVALTGALAVAFSVWTAVLAKAGDSMFRYSAERTAREVLYVPVPTELKLKAKAYVDVAVEKGVGKALSGVLIFVLTLFMDYRSVSWVALGLAVAWCYMAWGTKREYVAVLAESIRGRFANLEGGFASLTERSTLAMVEAALRSADDVEVGFGLDLVEQAGSVDAKHLADELELLLQHRDEELRVRALRLLARFPELVGAERLRACLRDDSEQVNEAAVAALAASCADAQEADDTIGALADSDQVRTRLATLRWLLRSGAAKETARRVAARRVEALLPHAGTGNGLGDAIARCDATVRQELALAGGLLGEGTVGIELLSHLLSDVDAGVSEAAIRSVGRAGSPELCGRLVSMLGDQSLRGRVKEGLIHAGPAVLEICERRLMEPRDNPEVRSRIAQILGHIPEQRSVDILQGVLTDPAVPWSVWYAALKGMNKLRAGHREALEFDGEAVARTIDDVVEDAGRYLALAATLEGPEAERDPATALLGTAAWEAWTDRREGVFRLLGLVFHPDEVYRSHGTLGGSDDRRKANALEWLERTLGHALFRRVLPVLDGRPSLPRGTKAGDRELVARFATDSDVWIAQLAGRVHGAEHAPRTSHGRDGLDVIGKAFLLQKVDLLEGARSSHLGLLATISEEIEADEGEVLIRSGEPNDALYVIIRGSVTLSGVGDHTLTTGEGTAFGTFALIDSAPSVVGARALERTRLLRITRSDFQELLSDHPELATGMLQALARRLRSLVA